MTLRKASLPTTPLLLLVALGGLTGCRDRIEKDTPREVVELYSFISEVTGEESVARSGQIFRHLLISEMKGYIGDLTASIDEGERFPGPGDVEADLNFWFEFDSDIAGSLNHGFSEGGEPLQLTFDDISSGKDLVGKLAGNDEVGQHRDWSMGVSGYGAGDLSPEELLRSWFAELDTLAVDRAAGVIPLNPMGDPIEAVHVTADGRDLKQLIEKFLRGGVAFSQATDDYLDDDTDGKGLNSDHTTLVEGKSYTELEHAWDEAFGYFGAALAYPSHSDSELADSKAHDDNGDGLIDLLDEVSWGDSQGAAKRDNGIAIYDDQADGDLSGEAWAAFARGRHLLAETAGSELTDEEREELLGYRDDAVGAWERTVAATAVHYINDSLADINGGGSFEDLAKHFSELKGFALSLQFNPRSALTDEEFATLHALIGDAPAPRSGEELASDLLEARGLLVEAYGFSSESAGDEVGNGGW